MDCPRCGFSVTKETGFCPSCGASLLRINLTPGSVSSNHAFSMAGNLDDSPVMPEYVPPVYPGEETVANPPPPVDYAWPPVNSSDDSTIYTPPQLVWDQVNSDPAPVAPAAEVPQKGGFCPNCGDAVLPGSLFCGNCGYPLGTQAAPVDAAPVDPAPFVDPAPYVPPVAPPVVPPVTPRPPYVPPVEPSSYVPPASRGKSKGRRPSKKSKALVPILIGVAVLVIAAVIAGILLIPRGVAIQIGSAAQKTLDSGSFTTDFVIDADGEEAEGTAWVNLDTTKEELTVYAEFTFDGYFYAFGIYDGYAFYQAYYDGVLDFNNWADISDGLDDFFASLEDSGDLSLSEYLEELDDQIEGDLFEIFDQDELETALVKFAETASKKFWLEKNAGYTTSTKNGETMHNFEFGLYQFMLDNLPELESAFNDPDDYDSAMDDLEDILDEGDVDLEISLGVKSGYLSSIQFALDRRWEGHRDVTFELSADIYDVGKTQLDVDDLEEMLHDIKN